MFFRPFGGYAVSQAPLDLSGRYIFDPHWHQNQAFTGVSSTILTSLCPGRDIVSVRLVVATNTVVVFSCTP